MHTDTAIVILAAGKSSRLGQPKQLLPFKGKSLLQHMIHTAGAVSKDVIVITGANAFSIESDIKKSGARTVFNKDWEEGMASSIRCGVMEIRTHLPELQAAIFMVCDQPFVTQQLLEDLIREQELSGKSIVASAYSDIAGTPVLFTENIFPELLELEGDTGARSIIAKNKERIATVSFPLGNVDMDTPEDYKMLLLQKDLI